MKQTFVSFKAAPTPWIVRPLPGFYDLEVELKIAKWRWVQLTELVDCLNRTIRDNPEHRLATLSSLTVLINFGHIMPDKSKPSEEKRYTYLTSDGQGFFESTTLPTCQTVLVPEGWGEAVMKFTQEGVLCVAMTEEPHGSMKLEAIFANNYSRRSVRRFLGEWNWGIDPSPVEEAVGA